MLLIAIVEGMAMVVGATLSGVLQHHLPDPWDNIHGPFDKLLGWLHVGRVPFLVLVVLFLAGFALSSDSAKGTLEDAAYCFNVMLAWASVPLVAAAFALRRSFVGRAGWRSALIGIGAGLVSASVMNLHCSLSDAMHMTLGHGLAVVLAGVAGAFGLERALRV